MITTTSSLAVDVQFVADALRLRLADGREIAVPPEWVPRLRDATAEQQRHWRLIGRGIGIHWEDLDEDLSVAGLLRG
jgi:hypothetical protein